MVQTDERVAAVRRAVPATEKIAFLNTGSYGPLSAAAAAAIAAFAEEELYGERLGTAHFLRVKAIRTDARARFARVLGCDPTEIALTNSTTAGMNYATFGLPWREGDEVVTTDVEHFGGVMPLYVLEHRFGVRVRFARTGGRPGDVLSAIKAEIGERTRAVIVSHVSWSSGIVLPLAEISDLAHQAGALCIVDGAQSAGAIPLDMHALRADAYAVPGQKWLCGPEGSGALYVAHGRMGDFLPSHVGHGAFAEVDIFGGYSFSEEAGRFDPAGNLYAPALAGMVASLSWLLDDIGLDWIYQRVLENATRCRALLEQIEGVEILTPPGPHAGLVHFNLAGWEALAVAQELLARGVSVRDLHDPFCVRASTGFFNNEDDLQALADGVREILKLEPHRGVPVT